MSNVFVLTDQVVLDNDSAVCGDGRKSKTLREDAKSVYPVSLGDGDTAVKYWNLRMSASCLSQRGKCANTNLGACEMEISFPSLSICFSILKTPS